ncbi:hypothetical protein BACCAP_04165 [Pseudoflavonifractor capillosus ATCC 29799]|uniref:Uncharacterized protein n=1 Tax=Pseudoflavonifractor capillosus ATCC 29799 TaxID=411467 RepID=A6P0Z9_9FIRM|nr:hypothetical protein BACCAP_04165 [Pseudoflavonifractor capillosus ATCC 29799]
MVLLYIDYIRLPLLRLEMLYPNFPAILCAYNPNHKAISFTESLPLAEYGTKRYTGYHNKELDAISL